MALPKKNQEKPAIAAIIVGAGSGTRAQVDGNLWPKQFVDLGGQTTFQRAVAAFADPRLVQKIICVHPSDLHPNWPLPQSVNQIPLKLCAGGNSRQLSVLNGLQCLEQDPTDWELVLIHDAARPFISRQAIRASLEAARQHGGAVVGVQVHDSLKRAADDSNTPLVETALDRRRVWQAQTPQTFRFDEILAAHNHAVSAGKTDYTDDASLYEAEIGPVVLSPGDRDNWKITTADDVARARAYFTRNTALIPDIRVGHGYDVHAFEDGDTLTLCGIDIPFSRKLKGHSDADVGLHTLTDAIYGALADGDIGAHFPPSDDTWKAAASDQFLRHAVELAQTRGAIITHLDLTLICEAPKIGPHRDAMRTRVAEITGLALERVSIKATTTERLGFTGRAEGIAASATATLVFPAKQGAD